MILTMCQVTIVVVVIVAQSETVLLNTVAKITGNFLRILRFPPPPPPKKILVGRLLETGWNAGILHLGFLEKPGNLRERYCNFASLVVKHRAGVQAAYMI